MSAITIPNTFAGTDSVSFTEINENFQEIASKINTGMDADNIVSSAVTNAKIADGAINNAKVATDADIAGSKIADTSIDIAKIIELALTNAKFTGILPAVKGGTGYNSLSNAVNSVLPGLLSGKIKIDSGQNNSGSYPTVNGVTSSGSAVEYYTGFKTVFFMSGFSVYINDANAEVSVSPTTGYVIAIGSSSGWAKWVAVSLHKDTFGLS